MKKYVAIGVVMCSLLGVGCSTESVFRSGPSEDNIARVDVENAPDMVQVVASSNADSKAGVGHLRTQSWADAAAAFERALANNPGDVRSRFGLAVANEQMGNYAAAEAAYREALFAKNVPEYEAGLARVRGRH